MNFKKLCLILAILVLLTSIVSCQNAPKTGYQKNSYTFYGTFDTLIQIIAYTQSEQEFNQYKTKIQSRFEELSKLYDIYNNYDNINNIKTINDNAGIKPIIVNKDIIDLLTFSIEKSKVYNSKVNIALGAVLKIWHNYREDGIANPQTAKLPSIEQLKTADQHTNIDKIVINQIDSTVYLEDKLMSIDVGAVAKGFATEIVANEMRNLGLYSALISSGGNVKTIGAPMDGIRMKWGVGIKNPNENAIDTNENTLDTAFVDNLSVVTSGNYQRFYTVDDKLIHHLIDPATLMPANYYSSVTIVCDNSALADFLSTTAFLLPYQQSRKLIDSLDSVDALWVMPDNSQNATEGMKILLKNMGGATNN